MTPTQITTFAANAKGLLISQYVTDAVLSGLIAVVATEIQTLENAAYSLLNSMPLAAQPLGGGNWDILDKLGSIVGLNRNGLNDSDYLAQIKIQIRVNRSAGLTTDIQQITALLVAGAIYNEWPPAAFEEYLGNASSSAVTALLAFLGRAKGAGISAYVRYAQGTNLLIPKDSVSGLLGTGLEDFISKAFPNAPVSLGLAPES
jgi:hypothetical protein